MGGMTESEKVLAFVSFCIEEYKTRCGSSGRRVAELFERSGAMDYLLEHYDVLHSWSREAILDDLARFLADRSQGS